MVGRSPSNSHRLKDRRSRRLRKAGLISDICLQRGSPLPTPTVSPTRPQIAGFTDLISYLFMAVGPPLNRDFSNEYGSSGKWSALWWQCCLLQFLKAFYIVWPPRPPPSPDSDSYDALYTTNKSDATQCSNVTSTK